SAREWIDGLALGLPGIVAREDADDRQISAVLTAVFYAARDRRARTLPAQAVRAGARVDARDESFPGSRRPISYPPHADSTPQFASQPLLAAELAEGLGCERAVDLSALIAHAFE